MWPANASSRATASPYAPFRADGDRDRPRRVGRDELDLHALGALGRAAAVAVAHLGERLEEERVGQPEVDEARPGDLGGRDLRQLRELHRELRGELARRPPGRLRRPQRDVRREVAVRRILRPLELHVGARDLREARREAADRVELVALLSLVIG